MNVAWPRTGQHKLNPHEPPIGESEHVLLVNAELCDLGLVCGESDEVLSNGRLILCRLQEPLLCSVGVCDRLGGCESLGSDEEKGGLWVRVLGGFSDVCAVDVGDEVEGQIFVAVWLESLGDHDWAAGVGEWLVLSSIVGYDWR